MFTPAGKRVWSDTTGDDGIIKIPGSAVAKQQKPTGDPADPKAEDDWDNYRSQRPIAIVERAGDLAVVDGNWSNGIQTWNFGVREDRSGRAPAIRGFIQSDRGLYRPARSSTSRASRARWRGPRRRLGRPRRRLPRRRLHHRPAHRHRRRRSPLGRPRRPAPRRLRGRQPALASGKAPGPPSVTADR